MSQQLIPKAALYDHLFDRRRRENRIEFVSDFPEANDAEVVSALQVSFYDSSIKIYFISVKLHYKSNIEFFYVQPILRLLPK